MVGKRWGDGVRSGGEELMQPPDLGARPLSGSPCGPWDGEEVQGSPLRPVPFRETQGSRCKANDSSSGAPMCAAAPTPRTLHKLVMAVHHLGSRASCRCEHGELRPWIGPRG